MSLITWTCQHQSVGLKTVGESDEEMNKPFRCGECQVHFTAICVLHRHLKGGSYRYDADTMTAFPLHGATCSLDGESENKQDPSANVDSLEIIPESHEENADVLEIISENHEESADEVEFEIISEVKQESIVVHADEVDTNNTLDEEHEEPFQNVVELKTVPEIHLESEVGPENESVEQESRPDIELNSQETGTDIDFNKPSEKYYKVYTYRRTKRKRSDESGVINVLKIVDDTCVKLDENGSVLPPNFGSIGETQEYEGVGGSNIVTGTENGANKSNYSVNDKLMIKSEAEDQYMYMESVDKYSENSAEVLIEHGVETDAHNIEDTQSKVAKTVTIARNNNTQIADSVETESGDKRDDSISCNIKLPALYKALISTSIESRSPVDSLAFNSQDTGKGKLSSSESDPNNPLQSKEIDDFGTNIQHVIIDNIGDSVVLDKDLEQTVAAFDKLGEPQARYKQVVVTLHGMETDADGSVQIVVGEEDAAVFNTEIGDEILKALRVQAKEIPAHEKTQIVFNYLDPQHQDYDSMKYGDLSEESDSITDHQRPHISYIRASKRPRRMDYDDSLPKFRIPLPRADAQEDCVADLDTAVNVLNQVEVKPVVFKILHEKLNWKDALNIITECNSGQHSDLISKTQPVLAKGGELYVVDLDALPHRKDCRYDKYLWMNCVTRKFPTKNPIMNKHVFKIRLPNSQFSDAFQRHIYQFIEESARYCVIHYIGHEGVFQPLSHGNSKTGAVFNRTCPSVLKELRDLSKEEGMTANKLHKQIESLTVPSYIRGFRTPRNLGQIKNTFKNARRKDNNQAQEEMQIL